MALYCCPLIMVGASLMDEPLWTQVLEGRRKGLANRGADFRVWGAEHGLTPFPDKWGIAMGLTDWFKRKPTEPLQPAEPTPEQTRFSSDRSKLFDIERTATLAALLRVPAGERDLSWSEAFHDAAWYASVVMPTLEPFVGPDGFAYLRFDIPHEGPFDSQSLGNLAAQCVDARVGAALFASPDDPVDQAAFVFSMGALDGMLRFGTIDGDPVDAAEAGAEDAAMFDVDRGDRAQTLTVRQAHEVMIGAPSRSYLPPSSAGPLYDRLTRGWGVEAPRVALLMDPAMRPTRSLVLGVKRSDFPADAPIDDMMRTLLWYLPPRRMLILTPEDWTVGTMTPLADYI
jgi:hypothetical protein